jgi:hypothetical protein
MIRTLIEVTADNDWDHRRKLEATLKTLGFEPRPSEDEVRFRSDLYAAILKRGMSAFDLVEEYRAGLEIPK